MDRKNVNLDKEMRIIKNETEARVLYEFFGGECEDKTGQDYVMVKIPDDSGMICEDEDGDMVCKKYGDIFVSEKKYKRILNKIEEIESHISGY